jgi:hypothetical protein
MKVNDAQLSRFTVLIEPTAVRRLKLLAIDDRVSASTLVRDAVQIYLTRRTSTAPTTERREGTVRRG